MITHDKVVEAFSSLSSHPIPGLGVYDGWLPLLGLLAEEIRGLPEAERSGFKILQVKEKFGALRFYYTRKREGEASPPIVAIDITSAYGNTRIRLDGGSPSLDLLVSAAELASMFICEDCGDPGRIRHMSWIKCLCDKHYEETRRKRTGKKRHYNAAEEMLLDKADPKSEVVLKMLSKLWRRDVDRDILAALCQLRIVDTPPAEEPIES